MLLIAPIEINDSKLTSTIPEPDTARGEVEWAAGSYNLGDRVIKSSTHSVYEVVADPSTTDDPEVGVKEDPATWVYVGPTNKFKMFDAANNTSTVGDSFTVQITPLTLINSVACFNVNCNDINITVRDSSSNIVKQQSIEMRTREGVNGWYGYYFSGIQTINKFVSLDIPPTSSGSVEVEFVGTDASVGTCVLGLQKSFGDAQYGTGAQILDYSLPVEDGFGNITYSDGFKAKLVDFDILANTADLDSIFVSFQNLGKTPAVFVGNPTTKGDMTLVYGFVRDFQPVYSTPTKSTIGLTVTGLI